jgi:hypothetical protein
MRKENFILDCPCELAKQFPIELSYDENNISGPKTEDIECPFPSCKLILTIELPGAIPESDVVFRGEAKKKEGK